MDSFDDDDILFVSDDESIGAEIPCTYNPVDDHLIKQLNDVENCIQRVKNEIVNIEALTEKVIECFSNSCKRIADENDNISDNECELFNENYEPVIKKRKSNSNSKLPLEAGNIWQRIIDDHWILGVELKNNSRRTLEKPTLYLMMQKEREIKGVTSFWETINESLWTKTSELNPESDQTVAVAVLDMPNFQDSTEVRGFGTITYTLDGHELQTPIDNYSLNISQAVDKLLTPRYGTNRSQSILAMKAISYDKVIAIMLDGEPSRGAKLLDFIQEKDFLEIMPDVHISKNTELLRHCMFELLSVANSQVMLRVSARSLAQLNIMVHMLLNEFPDSHEIETYNKVAEAASALEKELELKIENDNSIELLNARITTDLLMA